MFSYLAVNRKPKVVLKPKGIRQFVLSNSVNTGSIIVQSNPGCPSVEKKQLCQQQLYLNLNACQEPPK